MGSDKTGAQALMFANRLQKRFRHLKKWARRTGAGVFRLYDRDIPEIPLVLDYYDGGASARDAALAGALYQRPYEKDDEERWLEVMKESAGQALGIEPARIFLKTRLRQRGASQYEKQASVSFTKTVNEGGLSFKVNLSDYLDCGLFPDRRLLRALIRCEAAGKKVLNLFSYTGSFSVYAAAGGAVSTDSVDLSNTYLAWARENFLLNGFPAQMALRQEDFPGKDRAYSHKLIRADALEFIDRAAAKKLRWDIIIVDPPAFSNSKKMNAAFDLHRDKIELIRKCLGLLAPGGKIILSVNTRGRKTTQAELEEKLALHTAGIRVEDIGSRMIDEDFRGRKTPGSFIIRESSAS